jgi:hypothetical protein
MKARGRRGRCARRRAVVTAVAAGGTPVAITDPGWSGYAASGRTTMVGGGGQNQFDEDAVSALSRRGNSFSVTTWLHA